MADENSTGGADNPGGSPAGRVSAEARAAAREKLRADRLATALRENLKRRKAQARGRAQTDEPAATRLPD